MNKTFKTMYLEAEIICPQCGKKIIELSPDKDKATDAGCQFLCVACKVVVLVALIAPDPRHRTTDEAEAGGGRKAIYHECGNCGVARFEHDGIIEKCLNCGDDEIDVAQIGEVP